MEHQKGYGGGWHGAGETPPDRERCAAAVWNGGSAWGGRWKQCQRKAKYDPDANGKPTTCGVHSEARKQARRAKQDAKWEADRKRDELRGDIAAVRRVIDLVERRNLSVAGWDFARDTLGRILAELQK